MKASMDITKVVVPVHFKIKYLKGLILNLKQVRYGRVLTDNYTEPFLCYVEMFLTKVSNYWPCFLAVLISGHNTLYILICLFTRILHIRFCIRSGSLRNKCAAL